MRSIKPTTIRLSNDDKALIETIKQRYGLSSTIQAIRLALRVLVDGHDAMRQANELANNTSTVTDKDTGV